MSGNNRGNWAPSWPGDAMPRQEGQETASSSAGGNQGYWDSVTERYVTPNTNTSSAAPYTSDTQPAYSPHAAYNPQSAYYTEPAYSAPGSTGQVYSQHSAGNPASAPTNANAAPGPAAPPNTGYAGPSTAMSAAASGNDGNTHNSSAPVKPVRYTYLPDGSTPHSRSIAPSVKNKYDRQAMRILDEFQQMLDDYALREKRKGRIIGWICKPCKEAGIECRIDKRLPKSACDGCAKQGSTFCYEIELLPNEPGNWREKPDNEECTKKDKILRNDIRKFRDEQKKREETEKAARELMLKRMELEEGAKRRHDRAGTSGSGSSGREGKGGSHKKLKHHH